MKTKLTRTGMFVTGALTAALTPLLAKDQALDMKSILGKIEAGKSLKDSRAVIMEGAKKLKLAKDASIDDITTLLDKLEQKVEGVDEMGGSNEPMMSMAGEEDDEAMDAGVGSKIAEFLKTCMGRPLTEEDIAKVAEMAAAPAEDAENPFAKKDNDKKDEDGKKAEDVEPEKKPEMVSKKAMDAAIAAAVAGTEKKATQAALKLANDIAIARETVEDYVGKLSPTVAFDSAEQVYEKALAMKGVKTEGIHPSAFKAVLEAQPTKAAADHRTTQIAMDAEPSADFSTRFPGADRIKMSA